MSEPIDFAKAKKRKMRVPRKKKKFECPRCFLEVDLRQDENNQITYYQSEYIRIRDRCGDLEEALKEIYALNGEDEHIQDIMVELDI